MLKGAKEGPGLEEVIMYTNKLSYFSAICAQRRQQLWQYVHMHTPVFLQVNKF